MDVRICGPNLNDQSRGTFHVHSDGCMDLRHYGPGRKQGGERDGRREMQVKDATVAKIVAEVYADHIAEQPVTSRLSYAVDLINDFWFAPCVTLKSAGLSDMRAELFGDEDPGIA